MDKLICRELNRAEGGRRSDCTIHARVQLRLAWVRDIFTHEQIVQVTDSAFGSQIEGTTSGDALDCEWAS